MPCKILFLILFLLLFVCCYRDAPSALDGDNQAIFFVEYDKKPVINMPVTLNTDDYEMEPVVEITDDQGMVYFDHLLVADYQANVVFEKPFYSVNSDQQEKHLILIGNCDFRPVPSAIYRDTIITITAGQGEGLKINEIYYS